MQQIVHQLTCWQWWKKYMDLFLSARKIKFSATSKSPQDLTIKESFVTFFIQMSEMSSYV